MSDRSVPELWEWAEYYCPWCYVAAVRIHGMRKEYEGRVAASTRFFPIELLNGEEPPRDILEQEWWLAAVQEPAATFVPYTAPDWPTTTLPAFDAVWAARQQGADVAADMDLRVRHAFFGESRNIGNRDVLLEIAHGSDLDFAQFERDFASPAARAAVTEEGQLGRERYKVRGTPTLMLGNGTRLHTPIAMPKIRNRRIVSMPPLTCFGDACQADTRALFEAALAQGDSSHESNNAGAGGTSGDTGHREQRGADTVEPSTLDSFPASDAPSWTPLRLGSP